MVNFQFPNFGAAIIILILWETFWKIMGLWRAAKRGDKLWFIAIFIINFLGLIPIFYLWRTKQLNGVIRDVQQFFSSRFKKK